MGTDSAWLCANCDTLVDREETRRCPTCGHVFFYPLATAVSDSDGSGSVAVEDFDVDDAIERLSKTGRPD